MPMRMAQPKPTQSVFDMGDLTMPSYPSPISSLTAWISPSS
jgi:hypothetical protein